ncbi:unnamed protein product, partial [Brenthis ino]
MWSRLLRHCRRRRRATACADLRTDSFGKFLTETDDAARPGARLRPPTSSAPGSRDFMTFIATAYHRICGATGSYVIRCLRNVARLRRDAGGQCSRTAPVVRFYLF